MCDLDKALMNIRDMSGIDGSTDLRLNLDEHSHCWYRDDDVTALVCGTIDVVSAI